MLQRVILVLIIGSLVIARPISAQAKLPADLVFTAAIRDEQKQTETLLLARVDAQTMSIMPFFSDNTDETNLRAIRWSPNGDLLIIYRYKHINKNDSSTQGYRAELCILDRVGILKTCFADSPSALGDDNNPSQLETISWSSDEKYIYFATQTKTTVQLVEAEVATGKTLRTLYEYANSNNPQQIPAVLSWTRDLNYVAVNTDVDPKNVGPMPRQIVSIAKGLSQSSVNTWALSASTSLDKRLCVQFSPQGNYLAVINHTKQGNDILNIIDKSGQVLHVVSSMSELGSLRIDCPLWNKDEKRFYFLGSTEKDAQARVFAYSLESKSLSVIYREPATLESQVGLLRGLRDISADGQYLAVNGMDNPNLAGYVVAAVIYPDASLQTFLGTYFYTRDPLWIPKLAVQ